MVSGQEVGFVVTGDECSVIPINSKNIVNHAT